MTESLDALRQAAVTLLAAASPGAVLAATRALLADWELDATPGVATEAPEGVRHNEGANGTAAPAPPPAASAEAARAIPAQPTLTEAGAAYATQRREEEAAWFSARPAAAAPNVELTAWEDLRQRVREARQARGVSIQDLAAQLGMAKTTLENALQCRALPSTPTRTRLTAWLAAPEVAAAEVAFRPNGASYATGATPDAEHACASA
jgi:DNA-binding transcriptional regulator YiaG